MGFIHQQYKFKMGFKDTKTNVNVVFVEICRWIPQVSVFLHKEWNKGTDVLYSNAQLQKCIKNLYGDLMYSHNCSLWTLSSITKQPCLSLCCNYTAMATAPVCPPYTISFPSALKTTICKYQWNLVGKLDNDTGCHWLTKAQCPSQGSVSWKMTTDEAVQRRTLCGVKQSTARGILVLSRLLRHRMRDAKVTEHLALARGDGHCSSVCSQVSSFPHSPLKSSHSQKFRQYC